MTAAPRPLSVDPAELAVLHRGWQTGAETLSGVARQVRGLARDPALSHGAELCPAEAARVGQLLRRAVDDEREGLAVLATGLGEDAARLGRAADAYRRAEDHACRAFTRRGLHDTSGPGRR